MEELLELAGKVCDGAEVYSIEHNHNSVVFKNARLHDINSYFQSGLSLRIIKNRRLGFAYTRNLIDREELVRNALDSLKGGVSAEYEFPFTRRVPEVETFDAAIEKMSTKELVDECGRVCDVLASRTDGEISASSFTYTRKIRILNSSGTDVFNKTGVFGIYAGSVFPGSASGIWRLSVSKKFKKMSDVLLGEIAEVYTRSRDVVEPKGGKMKVMFMPNSAATFEWRILSGTSSKSVYEKTSPVADKLGQKIFDEKFTLVDDPLNDEYPGARAFDDEGVACSPLSIIEEGVLRNIFYDLDYASKLGVSSTGHGYKSSQWGGDPISIRPTPTLSHVYIAPGGDSFWDLVRSIDRGLVMEGALGAHSGNIPNGDYSVGANPGIYVENGEIIGRVKGAMVAGNIYETLKNVVGVGDTLYYSAFGGWAPAILFDGVSVAAKS
jgi:PmbA protein